ncbi:phosphoglycolate phosphatase 1A, chloroplastic-like [Pieris brassicae]|uniref:phosphoglycolate phosphatase 1A, chloroplastic-like n=1 Tax=Pieris brassicae TaxID=7116 RepID=UPI001E6605FC|nr:phosphoglycolate phosphatase 1A, chloroplastic-like [Pieris brassicae]
MLPINLNKVNSDEFKQFIDSFDHVFSDCDGVIWNKDPLPGSGDFFNLMKKFGKTVHFVSNNSLRSKENYEKQFHNAGIDNGYVNLTVPSTAIAEYLKSVNFNKFVYCVSCPETISVLTSNGFKCKEGPEQISDYYGDFLQYTEDDEDIGAVVFDSDFKVNLPKLYKAITYLERSDVIFLSGATDKYVPLKPDRLTLGTGIFTQIVCEESKRSPIQLGKPGREFGEFAMKRANVTEPSRVLFIGDMIEQDIGLGKNVGFKTLLVLTHRTKEEMQSHTIKPDFFADSLGSLIPQLNMALN